MEAFPSFVLFQEGDPRREAALFLMKQKLEEVRAANIAKEKELELRMEELKVRELKTKVQREMLDMSSEELQFSSGKQETYREMSAEDQVKFAFSDYFVSGLVVITASTGECIRRHVPQWLDKLKGRCQKEMEEAAAKAAELAEAVAATAAEAEKKASFFTKMANKVKEYITDSAAATAAAEKLAETKAELVRQEAYCLCMIKGSLGLIVAGLLCLFLLYLCKKGLQSSSKRRSLMPATLFVVGGSVIGCVGKEVVDVMGGNGHSWMVAWWIFCLVHAMIQVMPSVFAWLFRKSRVVKVVFHFGVAVVLPASIGLVAFPGLMGATSTAALQ